jgi:inhibitor of KinA
MTSPRWVWRPYGERAVVLEFGEVIDARTHDAVLRADAAVRREMARGALGAVQELVASYRSLLVRVHPGSDLDATRSLLEPVVNVALAQVWATTTVAHDVQVQVTPADAEDLEEVAAQLGLSSAEVVALLTSVDLRVYLHGFAPGFTYLGGVPAALHLPRRATPRPPVQAGSVLLAAGQIALCPSPMPTGWWVVGRTDHPLFDATTPPHVPFAPGSAVRLRASAGCPA